MLLTAALCLALGVTGGAHAVLESSQPAAGDTITAYPAVIRLLFSEPIESAFAAISLTDGTGTVRTLAPRIDPRNANALVAAFPALPPGGYLVLWRVVSADGHPIGGHYTFYAAVGPQGSSPAALLAGTLPAPDPPPSHAEHAPAGTTGEPPLLAAAVRGGALGTLMALSGLGVLLTWVMPPRHASFAGIERILVIAAPILLAGDYWLWLQHASPDGVVDGAAISASLSTRNGAVYLARVALGLAAAWALLLARQPALATVFAALALLASSATGHPAAISPALAVPGKAIHLAAVALWLGGLLILGLSARAPERFGADARRVSTIALLAVIAVAVTGALEAILFLPSVRDLVASAYGRLVLAKSAGLAGLVAFGAWHRFRALPRLASGAADAPGALQRTVRWESGLMAAVVILAAVLAYVPPPANPGAAADIQEHRHDEGEHL